MIPLMLEIPVWSSGQESVVYIPRSKMGDMKTYYRDRWGMMGQNNFVCLSSWIYEITYKITASAYESHACMPHNRFTFQGCMSIDFTLDKWVFPLLTY